MGHWNYRIIHHPHEYGDYYGLHEVYYTSRGRPYMWTEEPSITGDSPSDIVAQLSQMLFDCNRYAHHCLYQADLDRQHSTWHRRLARWADSTWRDRVVYPFWVLATRLGLDW